MKKVNPWLLTLITIVLIIVFTPIFGKAYEVIIGRQLSSGLIGYGHPEYFEGLLMAYAFFMPLMAIVFYRSKKYFLLSFLIMILLLLDIFLGAWQNLIINLITAIIGWLLGEGILRLYKLGKK